MSRAIGSFSVSHECALDAKWMLIGRDAGVQPSFAAGVWLAVLTHASAAQPRGSIAGFDAEALAVFNGCTPGVIEGVLAQFRARKLITTDDRLTAWAKRQGIRTDRTNRDRQKRHREKSKAERNGVTGVTTPKNVTPLRGVTGGVTQSNDRYEKGGDMGGFALPTISTPEQVNTSNERSIARTRTLARGEISEELDRQKAGGKTGWWLWPSNTGRLDALAAMSLTHDELQAAIAMARQRRVAEGSSQPVNIGLVASMVGELRDRAAKPPTSSAVATRQVAGHSPDAPADPLGEARQFARHMESLGRFTAEEAAGYVAEAEAKIQARGAKA